jgi:DNA polymerase-3 subunit gamma/tau
MRDALSIFDQAASFCQGNITYQKVIEDLNVLDAEYYFNLVDYSLTNNVSQAMVLLNDVINKGFDGGLLIQGLARHVRNVLMAKDPQTLPLLEVSEQLANRYQEQAKKCPTPFLYQALQLMNQCDLNYRQSSNKRLLVELTLIEIAQLTQPDDSTPGSGRKPRQLKSLFKHLVQQAQPRKAAPQVAVAEPAAPTTPATPVPQPTLDSPLIPRGETHTSEQAGSASPRGGLEGEPNNSPKMRLSGIGTSWKKLKEQTKPSKMQILPGTPVASQQKEEEDQPFTQQDLELQWMAMCNRMPQRLIGIATRMKNMNPVITTFPEIEVEVSNQMIFDEITNIKGSITNTLKLHLNNNAITVSFRIAEQQEQAKILTRREQFEEMEKDNPAIAKLRQVFDLELA